MRLITFSSFWGNCLQKNNIFPPARWGSLGFIWIYHKSIPPPQPFSPSSSSTASCRRQWALPDLIRECQISVGPAGPQPWAPDVSEHCWTSTASPRAQWALPDLNREWALPDLIRECQISVGPAGPQPWAPDVSEHCWTSTASPRAQWALPDVNCESRISVGTAGHQLRVQNVT